MARKKPTQPERREPKTIENRRARRDYEFLETYEAGIALAGAEVKSVWLGRVNLTDAHCVVRDGEIWLVNLDIEPYAYASAFQLERRRDRKLLLHKKEIETLHRKVQEKGLALIPGKIYFKNGRVKVLVAVARGKKQYDKREQIAERETRREIERARSIRGR